MNYYQVLQVSPQASTKEIQQAYRIKVQIYHPDRFQGMAVPVRQHAEERLKEINQAYRTLRDPVQRHQYDLWLKQQALPKQSIPQKPAEDPATIQQNLKEAQQEYQFYHQRLHQLEEEQKKRQRQFWLANLLTSLGVMGGLTLLSYLIDWLFPVEWNGTSGSWLFNSQFLISQFAPLIIMMYLFKISWRQRGIARTVFEVIVGLFGGWSVVACPMTIALGYFMSVSSEPATTIFIYALLMQVIVNLGLGWLIVGRDLKQRRLVEKQVFNKRYRSAIQDAKVRIRHYQK